MAKTLTFVTGGARSGKSLLAERIGGGLSERVLYVATAEPGDAEMTERIRRHQDRRPEQWQTLEVPRQVVTALRSERWEADVILLDCLSLWVSNLMLDSLPGGEHIPSEAAEAAMAVTTGALDKLLQWYRNGPATLIVVSNEVGSGVVPVSPLARLYRDVLGVANQTIAAEADHVYYCVAGRVLDLSDAQPVETFGPLRK